MLSDLQGLRDDFYSKLDVIADDKKWDNSPDLTHAKTRKFSNDFGCRVNASHSPLEHNSHSQNMVKSDHDSHRIIATVNDMDSMNESIYNLDSNSILPNLRKTQDTMCFSGLDHQFAESIFYIRAWVVKPADNKPFNSRTFTAKATELEQDELETKDDQDNLVVN